MCRDRWAIGTPVTMQSGPGSATADMVRRSSSRYGVEAERTGMVIFPCSVSGGLDRQVCVVRG